MGTRTRKLLNFNNKNNIKILKGNKIKKKKRDWQKKKGKKRKKMVMILEEGERVEREGEGECL